MFHHIINYHHVSITFAIIIGVALHEYKEHNNLPYCISGTTKCYNKTLSSSTYALLQFTVFLELL